MIEVSQTDVFAEWFSRLRDRQAKARISIRVRRVSLGNFGDSKSVGDGVFELRITYGPGYRLYFHKRGDDFVLLLAGGDKSTQDSDIKLAKQLAANL